MRASKVLVKPLLIAAIRERWIAHLCYDWGHRIVEPHVYGKTREGQELLRAFQVGGHSDSGNPFGWKLFRVEEIPEIHLPGTHFKGTRREYNTEDPVIIKAYAKL